MPTTIVQLLAWLGQHWFGALVFAIVAGLIIWRWATAGKESAEGPVIYAKKKHQAFLFVIGIITLILVVLFIIFVGPWLGKFFIWGISTGVVNTEGVILGTPSPIPSAANSQVPPTAVHQSLVSPTPGSQQSLLSTTGGQPYCVTMSDGATVRPEPNSTAGGPNGLGNIPAGTTIKIGSIVDSTCVNNVCQRGQLAEASGSFPVGSWIHLAAVTVGACP